MYQNLLVSSESLIGVCHELSINNDIVMVSSGTEEVKRRWEAFTEKVQSQEKDLKNSNKTLALVSDISHLVQSSFCPVDPRVSFVCGLVLHLRYVVLIFLFVLEGTRSNAANAAGYV